MVHRTSVALSTIFITFGGPQAHDNAVENTNLGPVRKNSLLGGKAVPQGLKPDIFSIIYGPTKVVA
jgi:hypothetical protein